MRLVIPKTVIDQLATSSYDYSTERRPTPIFLSLLHTRSLILGTYLPLSLSVSLFLSLSLSITPTHRPMRAPSLLTPSFSPFFEQKIKSQNESPFSNEKDTLKSPRQAAADSRHHLHVQ